MSEAIDDTITEEAISRRIKTCGMRIERRHDGYVLLYYGKTLLAVNAHGQPLSLADLDRVTQRFV